MKRLHILSLIAITTVAVSCKKETKQCDNGLNIYSYENCKCSPDEYLVSNASGIKSNGVEIGYNKCEILKDNEWIMTIQDAGFAYPSFVYQVLPPEKYELLGGRIEEPYLMLAAGSNNGYRGASCWYLGERKADGNYNVIMDFRPMENLYSIDSVTGHGFFITGEIVNGAPTNFKLNRGSATNWSSYEAASSTTISLTK